MYEDMIGKVYSQSSKQNHYKVIEVKHVYLGFKIFCMDILTRKVGSFEGHHFTMYTPRTYSEIRTFKKQFNNPKD